MQKLTIEINGDESSVTGFFIGHIPLITWMGGNGA